MWKMGLFSVICQGLLSHTPSHSHASRSLSHTLSHTNSQSQQATPLTITLWKMGRYFSHFPAGDRGMGKITPLEWVASPREGGTGGKEKEG